MRIITQDGTIDIPYENFVFGITKYNFIVAVRDTIARPLEPCQGIVAIYSSRDKAEKAMEMLRNVYLEYEKGMSTEYWFAFNFPKVFQFPQDEDVEV